VALPAPVAQTARAIVRGAVLALREQAEVQRLRIAWTLDGELEISVRDDGPGLLSASPSTDALAERARALGGTVEIQSVPGWGTELLARLPLDDRTGVEAHANDPLAALHPRELEVLAELALGRRNRDIAETLSISENTVKFHVANVFAKLGVSSRSQAALIARDAGLGRTRMPAV
jgi:DNA-binding CsgD family transcriptional regulator